MIRSLLVLLLLLSPLVASGVTFKRGPGGGEGTTPIDVSALGTCDGVAVAWGTIQPITGAVDSESCVGSGTASATCQCDEATAGWRSVSDGTGSGSLGSELSSTSNDILSSTATTGAILMGSELGGGSQERLLWDFDTTDDVVDVTSPSGVTAIDLSDFTITGLEIDADVQAWDTDLDTLATNDGSALTSLTKIGGSTAAGPIDGTFRFDDGTSTDQLFYDRNEDGVLDDGEGFSWNTISVVDLDDDGDIDDIDINLAIRSCGNGQSGVHDPTCVVQIPAGAYDQGASPIITGWCDRSGTGYDQNNDYVQHGLGLTGQNEGGVTTSGGATFGGTVISTVDTFPDNSSAIVMACSDAQRVSNLGLKMDNNAGADVDGVGYAGIGISSLTSASITSSRNTVSDVTIRGSSDLSTIGTTVVGIKNGHFGDQSCTDSFDTPSAGTQTSGSADDICDTPALTGETDLAMDINPGWVNATTHVYGGTEDEGYWVAIDDANDSVDWSSLNIVDEFVRFGGWTTAAGDEDAYVIAQYDDTDGSRCGDLYSSGTDDCIIVYYPLELTVEDSGDTVTINRFEATGQQGDLFAMEHIFIGQTDTCYLQDEVNTGSSDGFQQINTFTGNSTCTGFQGIGVDITSGGLNVSNSFIGSSVDGATFFQKSGSSKLSIWDNQFELVATGAAQTLVSSLTGSHAIFVKNNRILGRGGHKLIDVDSGRTASGDAAITFESNLLRASAAWTPEINIPTGTVESFYYKNGGTQNSANITYTNMDGVVDDITWAPFPDLDTGVMCNDESLDNNCDAGEEVPMVSSSPVWTGAHDFGGATVEVPNSATLPGTCTVGEGYMDTDATSGQRWYLCETTNNWVLQGGGGAEVNNLETVTTGIGADEIPMGTTTDTIVYKAMPSNGTNGCDGAGEALQYNTTTDTWDCLTGLGAGGTVDDISGSSGTTTGANITISPGTGVTSTAVVGDTLTIVVEATQAELDLKSPIASPTFTGTVTVPTPFTVGATSVTSTGTELNLLDGITTLSGSNTGDEVAADLTTAGVIEIAIGSEVNTGTSDTLAVSPDSLDDWTGSAQFTTAGVLTATSYDGIAAANLLDKAADETVDGEYTFSHANGLTSTNGFNAGASDTGAYVLTTVEDSTQVSWGISRVAANAASMDINVEDGGAQVTYILLDGLGQTIDLLKPIDISNGTSAGILRIFEPSGAGTDSTTFQSPATLAADVVYTLPPDDGDAGEQLQTDGSGVLTWESAGAGGGMTSWIVAGDTGDDQTITDGNTLSIIGAGSGSIATLGVITDVLTIDVIDDTIGTAELDDGADTPGSGEYLRVDTVDQAGIEYRSTAEVLSDIGAAPTANPTFTGIVTFPIAATPTTDADAEMSFDTDGWAAGFDALEIFNGTASAYVVATTASDTPTDGQVPTFNTGGTIDWQTPSGSGDMLVSTYDPDTNTAISGVVDFGETILIAARADLTGCDTGTANTCEVGEIVGFAGGYNACAEVSYAEADEGTGVMPAVGIVVTEVTTANCNGRVLVSGVWDFNADVITANTGDDLYVDVTEGDVTAARPTGATVSVQKIGYMVENQTNDDKVGIFGAQRSNDVPNIADDNLWVGSSTAVATAELLPDTDADGQALGWDQATNAFANNPNVGSSATLTSEVDGILPGANGGTNNGFMDFTGPTTSLKTFTLPDASSTILTDNADVTVAQGGTGASDAATARTNLDVPQAGTLTDTQFCQFNTGAGIDCNVADTGTGSVARAGSPTFTTDIKTPEVESTDAGDVLTLTGSASEDLQLDFDTGTANEVAVGTSTGVTDIDFQSLNLVTTGTIQGKINTVVETGTTDSPTETEMGGSFFIYTNTGAVTVTLPDIGTIASGMSGCFYNLDGTAALTMDPNANDQIRLDGVLDATPGDSITSGTNAGDYICIVSRENGASDEWITLGRSGTWTAN